MKREGWQHGMVRTSRIIPFPLNPRPETRFVNKFDSPPTCGLFTKVPQRPTNHSKFTGKCGRPRCTECHMHPVTKSKGKAKGTRKLANPRDLVSNYKMITWRVADGRPGLNYSGFSASGILNYLASDCVDDDDAYDADNDDIYDHYDLHNNDDEVDAFLGKSQSAEGMHQTREIVNADDGDHHEPDIMNFYDVGIVFDQVEDDEGWCLVGQM